MNTAVGLNALSEATSSFECTAVGSSALERNTTGFGNTALGANALKGNTTGADNIALGADAGRSLTTGSDNIDIGNEGVAGEANTIRIGTSGRQTASYIAGISGQTSSNGVAVLVNTDGKLGTLTSSARFKEDIQPMDKASEALFSLKPVSFRYKKEIDPTGTPQLGLVAEDVEKVNPDLIVRDKEGKPYSVRYEQVNAMLLNEFLKEHRKIEKLEVTIARQRKDFEAATTQQQKGFESKIAHQQKQIEALTAGLQKVSAQVETSRPAPQTVAKNQ